MKIVKIKDIEPWNNLLCGQGFELILAPRPVEEFQVEKKKKGLQFIKCNIKIHF